jgi:DNA-directed RNA polymerase subunit alpha
MKKITNAPYLPTEVEVERVNDNEARVLVYPFESGYAITLAHPIRRLLMSSSSGYAPIAIKIDDVSHEFDSVRGMLEDVALFIINLKNIRFKLKNGVDKVEVKYTFKGQLELKGADLENEHVDIVTPDLHLATLNSDCDLRFSIIIQQGIGYVPSEEIRDMVSSDYIPLDVFFTPVKKVVYNIEKMLVEDNPNYEKIIFDIVTDGQIDSIEAFKNAINTMYSQMSVFNKVFDLSQDDVVTQNDDTVDLKELTQKIEDLNLSVRSFNSLNKVNIEYVGELILMGESAVKSIKNLGKKSFDEITSKLNELGYPLSEELDSDLEALLRKTVEQLKS